MSRMLGLRNIVCTKDDWYYLCFYDIDKPITQEQLDAIDERMHLSEYSYMIYKTKHGNHFICLSPLDCKAWAGMFFFFKQLFNSYYSGNVIRLSQKKDEQQELIVMNTTYGEVIPNLYNLWAKRFNYEKMPWVKETSKYLLVFEKYRSENE